MSRLVWVCLAIALAGCEAGGAGNARGLCTAVCRCVAEGALPNQQRECVEECVADIDIAQVAPTCEECVFEHSRSCNDLFEVCIFGGACSDPDPPQPVP
jgi:hypothetical protein